jgi:hypothetical protein
MREVTRRIRPERLGRHVGIDRVNLMLAGGRHQTMEVSTIQATPTSSEDPGWTGACSAW